MTRAYEDTKLSVRTICVLKVWLIYYAVSTLKVIGLYKVKSVSNGIPTEIHYTHENYTVTEQ
jgi:hypothetical protein